MICFNENASPESLFLSGESLKFCRYANFFFRAAAINEAGSVPTVSHFFSFIGVPFGDLKYNENEL